ncbi:MAG: imidazole glycerol phosphate synthase subunit HisH [candidate division Zixibacteria bacterium]|nr:imidazole glycerol phosphate synthase subunit HisH [candidate division Zixibacteria bacterium]
MVGIVDYGMGNIMSVANALERIGAGVKMCRTPEDFSEVDRIILPGVGAFADCMNTLNSSGLVEALEDSVLSYKKPLFGICVGMQMLAKKGYEGGMHNGLGWINSEVVMLETSEANLRIPHIGWNNVSTRENSPIFKGLPPEPEVYFVHSYWMKCNDPDVVEATCDYGGLITASIRKDNIVATQFHPEKSQDYGLHILENFMKWKP